MRRPLLSGVAFVEVVVAVVTFVAEVVVVVVSMCVGIAKAPLLLCSGRLLPVVRLSATSLTPARALPLSRVTCPCTAMR